MLSFETETVSRHITRISAPGTELMYLVEGSLQNVLIDTGSGFGSLKTVVDGILDAHGNQRPLTVLLTHGHVDHACGAGEFTAAGIPVYMSPKDRYIYVRHTEDAFRRGGLLTADFSGHGEYEESDYIPSAAFEELKELDDGSRFDLGDVQVETFALPGHTLGSMGFLIREQGGKNYLLTGDACNTFTFLFQEYSTSVEEYEENLRKFAGKLKGRYDEVLLSHGDGKGYPGMLEDVCQVCEDIKNGTAQAIPFSFMGTEGKLAVPPETGRGNIVYHPDRIRKKDTVIC